jgi:AcrR family transcriptional regulator
MGNAKPHSAEERPYHHGDLRRALVEAALELVHEEQDWSFSLREVARRAGVSHNAPYNHFPDKQALLAAVASAGFRALGERMSAVAGVKNAETALIRIGIAYVKFGVENPAHYRLMFGSALMRAQGGPPKEFAEAAQRTRAILTEVMDRGAREGVFAASATKKKDLEAAVVCAWASVHGLTMLLIDERVDIPLDAETIAQKLARTFCYGLMKR